MPSPNVAQARSRLGVAVRRKKSPEEIEDARRDLKAAKLEAYVRRIVDEAPPLSESQSQAIAALLRPQPKAR